MKQLLPTFVLLVCFPAFVGATTQSSECLIYNGRECYTPVYPLESCPTVDEEELHLQGGGVCTSNLRGYVATWEVAENKLWLTDIETWIPAEKGNVHDFWSSFRKASLEDFFPGQVIDGRVHATWFTGHIFSPGYRWGSSLSDADRKKQEAEARLVVFVSNGMVQKIEACDVVKLPRKPTLACYGDSITAGAHLEKTETYPAVLQSLLPDAKVVNFGVGGNTSSQGRARLEKSLEEYKSALFTLYGQKRALTQTEKDAISNKPDLVVLLFGTNDSVLTATGKYRVSLQKYQEDLREMVLRCRERDVESILCTLSPIIPEPYFKRHPKEFYDAEGGLEEIVQRYRAAALEVGRELHVPVVDLYATFEKDMSLLRPAPDGVHPNARGAKVIAQEIAKLLTAERKPVPLEPDGTE